MAGVVTFWHAALSAQFNLRANVWQCGWTVQTVQTARMFGKANSQTFWLMWTFLTVICNVTDTPTAMSSQLLCGVQDINQLCPVNCWIASK